MPEFVLTVNGGVFELRPHRKAILWRSGKRIDHDYSRAEILCYVEHGDWRRVTEDEAELLKNAPASHPE